MNTAPVPGRRSFHILLRPGGPVRIDLSQRFVDRAVPRKGPGQGQLLIPIPVPMSADGAEHVLSPDFHFAEVAQPVPGNRLSEQRRFPFFAPFEHGQIIAHPILCRIEGIHFLLQHGGAVRAVLINSAQADPAGDAQQFLILHCPAIESADDIFPGYRRLCLGFLEAAHI